MIKTVYVCDVCGKEVDQSKILLVNGAVGIDVCYTCTVTLAIKVIKDRMVVLRPWCKKCNGNGIFRECTGQDGGGRNEYESHKCDECFI